MVSNSRYDFMEEGKVMDTVSKSYYPDPLSLSYLGLRMSKEPAESKMTDSKISFFWKETYDQYGVASWDDIVLTLNGISHINFLKNGDVIYFPAVDDIKSSFQKDR